MNKLFEGREAEGMFKGLWTLFVEGDVPLHVILDRYQRHLSRYAQVYFGAGGQSIINWNSVGEVARFKECVVTCDISDVVPSVIQRYENVHFHVLLSLPNVDRLLMSVPSERTQLKFNTEHSTLAWNFNATVFNKKSDILSDTVIWTEQ